jgi:hypothetical protein
MLGLYRYRYASWIDRIANRLCNLLRQSLLYLQSSGEYVNDARDLAYPDHLVAR